MQRQPLFLAALSLVAAAMIIFSLGRGPVRSLGPSATGQPEDAAQAEPLVVLCAASNRAVLEKVIQDYEEATGERVLGQYGPSQTLLSTLDVSRSGDLYLPADESYLKLATDRKLIDEVVPLATMQLVIAVKQGNPCGIQHFEDLLRSDVRLVQANPDVAAVGLLTRQALQPQDLWSALERNTIAFRTTVTEATNDVKLGAADATISYDVVLHADPTLEPIRLPELAAVRAAVKVAVLTTSRQRARALKFARFLSHENHGLKRYVEYGFTPMNGTRSAHESPTTPETPETPVAP
ncbi:molybdate ABC transporter substrate-binding protein [Planctomicrobium sp. SH664]|uniref:molybdate ABC transporter substrate-binding protein n=1 Tax=Planctomicrobium sp. SH664 TaxID=3448125 RepID=UPI003F5BF5C6